MLQFKPLDINDREIFDRYLEDYNFNTYEYTFINLFLWRKMCSVEYAIIDDALVIKKTEADKGSYFMQPIGYKEDNLKELVLKLNEIKKNIHDMKCLFRDIEDPFLMRLKELFGEAIKVCEDSDNFDYIYDTDKLVTLSGKKYHGQRNHVNQFINTYNYSVKDLGDPEVREQCWGFLKKWYAYKGEEDEQLNYEFCGIRDLLNNFDRLNIIGMAVYVEDKMVGFTIGEKPNRDMAIIHIEKGDPEYKGSYAFINKVFAEKYLNDVKYINREEDLGIEGLRRAKSSYHPIKLERKYIVELN